MADETPETDIETPAQRARARRAGSRPRVTPPKTEKEKPRPKTTLNPDGKRTAKWDKLEQQLTDVYTSIAIPFSMFGDEFTSKLILKRASTLASSWVDLAQENPSVERVINQLITGSAWGGVIVTHAMVVVPIAAHRGLIPGELGQNLKMAAELQMELEDAMAAASGNENGASAS